MTEYLLLAGALCGLAVGLLMFAEGGVGLVRALRVRDLGIALGYTVGVLVLGVGLAMLTGCSATPLEVRSVAWSGEGSVSVETSIASVSAGVEYAGILVDGEPIHCPVLSLSVDGPVTITLRGVPPSTDLHPVDAACYASFGTFATIKPSTHPD